MDVKEFLLQCFFKFFDKITCGSGIKNENRSDQQLAEELHKLIIKNLTKEKYIQLLQIIFGKLILLSKFNKGFIFLLCVIDIFSKYAWVIPLKDKKGITTFNSFQTILDESN